MRTDLTHVIRLRQLAADYEHAGVEFDVTQLDTIVKAPGTADYTGSEAARPLHDKDGRQAAPQAKTLGRAERR